MMTPAEMAQKIGSGLLSFPVTHFDAAHAASTRRPIAAIATGCSSTMSPGLFAAGGTGEFFSLTPAEVTAGRRRRRRRNRRAACR